MIKPDAQEPCEGFQLETAKGAENQEGTGTTKTKTPATTQPKTSPFSAASATWPPTGIDWYYFDDWTAIAHGDCRDILPGLPKVDLVLTDPPYGTGEKRNYASRQRGSLAACNDFPDIVGDFEPFRPTMLNLEIPTILWGGNHYADSLPSGSQWLIWDKLDGLRSGREVGFNDQADVEIAWSNLGGPARLFSHRWMGAMKAGEGRSLRRRHPTEKPVELMRWCLKQAVGVVLDPFMGSGTTLRAAKDLNRKAIGIEIEEKYCEIAATRMAQEVFDFS